MPIRKQKVVLRAKVRRERWQRLLQGGLYSLKFIIFAALIIFGSVSIYRFLFLSQTFMIKSLEVLPEQTPIAAKLLKEVAGLKGQSVFRANLGSLEKELKEKNKPLERAVLSRSFPDKVKLKYKLREPLAFLKIGERGTTNEVIDADGVQFDSGWLGTELTGVPDLVLASTDSIAAGVSFLKKWSEQKGELPLSTASLVSAWLDELGEISFYVKSASSSTTRVVWGNSETSNFTEKFDRLQQVWSDLRGKSMIAQYVNLREVPQKKNLVLGDGIVVGKAFVRATSTKGDD